MSVATNHIGDPRVLAIWKSDDSGQACNNGKRDFVAKVGLVQEIPGPLVLCGPGALHATTKPSEWKGTRHWLVALEGEVLWEKDKCGGLKRVFLAEIS